MNRLLRIALLTLLTCLLALGVAALGIFLHVRYGVSPSKVSEFEKRIHNLESQKRWHTRTWGATIVTADRYTNYQNWILVLTNQVELGQTFYSSPPKLSVGKKAVEAWLTDWSPRSEILKFEEFRVYEYDGAVKVFAKPRTNESISMEFWITGIY